MTFEAFEALKVDSESESHPQAAAVRYYAEFVTVTVLELVLGCNLQLEVVPQKNK